MRYETKPEHIRPQMQTRRAKNFPTTKEEDDQTFGETPNIYDLKTHTRRTIFKQPREVGGSLTELLPLLALF